MAKSYNTCDFTMEVTPIELLASPFFPAALSAGVAKPLLRSLPGPAQRRWPGAPRDEEGRSRVRQGALTELGFSIHLVSRL